MNQQPTPIEVLSRAKDHLLTGLGGIQMSEESLAQVRTHAQELEAGIREKWERVAELDKAIKTLRTP